MLLAAEVRSTGRDRAPAGRPWLERPRVRRWLIAAVIVGGVVAWWTMGTLSDELSSQGIRDWVDGLGLLGPAVFIVFVAGAMLVALIPNTPFPVAAGLVWGVPLGSLYALCGQAIGAVVVFYISRKFGRRFFPRLVGRQRAERIDELSTDFGAPVVFWARIAPFIPMDVAAYAAGLTTIRFKPFFVAFMLGSIPPTILAAWIGDSLTRSWSARILSVSVLLAVMLLTAAAWYVRNRSTLPTLREWSRVREHERPGDATERAESGRGRCGQV
jgi:uncharacterized membrane protein YdjX (TVP38/TMEM64 family)